MSVSQSTSQSTSQSVLQAYLACANYIQKKLPLENIVLKSIAAIGPELIVAGSKSVLKYLMGLPALISVLSDNELESYDMEVRRIVVDSTVPSIVDSDGNDVKCLDWWIQVKSKYPTIFKMATSILSIFHGPRVESSFSVMGDVINNKSGNMNVETLDAIQTVKYSLSVNQV